MKRILTFAVLFSVILTVGTGCLKDKGFEDHVYGINSPDTSPAGIGFPLAFNPNVIGLELKGTQQTVAEIIVVNLLSGNPAPNDIKVNIVANTTLVADYNTANGTSVVGLPTNLYNLSANPIIIPKGQNLGKIVLNIPNALTLDASKTYGLGFSISSVDAGYTIASNMKNIVVLFNIKNKYDGVYNLRGYHNRTPFTFPFALDVHMITTGPNSVAMYLLAPFGDYGQPIGVAPGVVNWYGPAVSPNFGFDPVTNAATTIVGMPANVVTLAYATDPGIVNKYDPATKKMFLCFQYNGNPLRRFYDTLTYKSPRP